MRNPLLRTQTYFFTLKVEKKLCTYYSSDFSGSIKKPLEFESDSGNSGLAFTKDRMVILNAKDHLELSFTDIDSVGNFTYVKSCAFIPLHNYEGTVVGVLQLYNKFEDEVTKTDIKIFKLMQDTLGRLLEAVIRLNDALDFMLEAKLVMEKIEKSCNIKPLEYEEGVRMFEEILRLISRIHKKTK